MNATLKDGKLFVDIWGVIELLSPEEKRDLADTVSCDSDVIKHVTSQILDRCTEYMSCGAVSYIATAEATCGLDWASREVAKRSGEVAKREIERLENALKQREEEVNKLHAELSIRNSRSY